MLLFLFLFPPPTAYRKLGRGTGWWGWRVAEGTYWKRWKGKEKNNNSNSNSSSSGSRLLQCVVTK